MEEETKATGNMLLGNARIVSVDRVIDNASLRVEGGRISHISDSDSLATADRNSVLDLSGLTLWPGFIDVHIHGAAGIDTMQASAEDLRRVSHFLTGHGVTSWLPTLVQIGRASCREGVWGAGGAGGVKRESTGKW